MIVNQGTKEFQLFRHMAKACYYFHIGESNKCLIECAKALALTGVEPRYKYIVGFFIDGARKKLGKKAKKNTETPCKKLLSAYEEEMIFFLTLRFFE